MIPDVATEENRAQPVVLVTLGTMHHPFDRLMGWIESWRSDRPGRARIIVQHGSSTLPPGVEGFPMSSHSDLLALMAKCDIVVTQGGPGGIMDSRHCGIRPIAVPRLPQYDEVVDDHQVRFCAYLAKQGLIELAADEAAVHRALDSAVADPSAMRVQVDHDQLDIAIARTGKLIEDLVARRPPRRRRHTR